MVYHSTNNSICIQQNRQENFQAGFYHWFSWAILYGIIRLTIPSTYVKNGSYEEDIVSLHSRIKGFTSWISYTWFAADYIAIVHKPSRNLILGLSTTILSCIFMINIWWNQKFGKEKNFCCLF